MKLAELSFACYIYSYMTDYDDSYNRFVDAVHHQLNLSQQQHRMALLKWLNEWGCRQFSLAHHELAAKGIWDWYRANEPRMFSADRTLLSLSDTDLAVVEQAFNELVGRTASMRRTKNRRESCVEIGPTGAAKILFALRPLALIPWDDPMRKWFHLNGSGRSYVDYLHLVKDNLRELEQDCEKRGHRLSDLPRLLGRPSQSLTKLVDEHFWVTISRKCPFPSEKDILLWTT
jgi:hypothetical protein